MDTNLIAAAIIFVGGGILLAILFYFYVSHIIKVGPNEVLIISGRGESSPDSKNIKSKYRIVSGGRAFVWPVLERVDRLSLEIMTIDITTPDVPTSLGVRITTEAVAQVRIGSSEEAIKSAAIQFLSKTPEQIQRIALATIDGHLRAALGSLTIEELYRNREACAQKVQVITNEVMTTMGLQVISIVIKDISDEEGYLEALGQPRIAQVKRDATIGQAEAERDATIESASAKQVGEAARLLAETQIAKSQSDYETEQAVYQLETDRRKAEAELAHTWQTNITNQEVKKELLQIDLIAREKQIEIERQEVLRREQELEASVRKPAEARRYQLQIEAQGEAEAVKLKGEAEAAAARAKGLAEVEVLREMGKVEAENIRLQGLAEAEATLKKAAAWQEYTQAAILQQLLDTLPGVAAAIAEPLSKTERIVVVNTGGDGQNGAGTARITKDITDIIAQVPAAVEALTGMDILAMIGQLGSLKEANIPQKDVESILSHAGPNDDSVPSPDETIS